jgi:hypothetical protein
VTACLGTVRWGFGTQRIPLSKGLSGAGPRSLIRYLIVQYTAVKVNIHMTL